MYIYIYVICVCIHIYIYVGSQTHSISRLKKTGWLFSGFSMARSPRNFPSTFSTLEGDKIPRWKRWHTNAQKVAKREWLVGG